VTYREDVAAAFHKVTVICHRNADVSATILISFIIAWRKQLTPNVL